MVNFFSTLLDNHDLALIQYILNNQAFSDLILFELKIEDRNIIYLIYQILLKVADTTHIHLIDDFFCKHAKFVMNYICDGINNS